MEVNCIVKEIVYELLNAIALGTTPPPSLIIEPDSCSGKQDFKAYIVNFLVSFV